jgi:hypothetical protein
MANVRYFLDTEFNGFGGTLLSLALVPEDGEEFYAIIASDDPLHPWVERNVIPYLNHVPIGQKCAPIGREQAASAVAAYLAPDLEPLIVADWPDDISQFCSLLLLGPGRMVPLPTIDFQLLPLPNFSTSHNSKVPHNALHDARALRDHVLHMEHAR